MAEEEEQSSFTTVRIRRATHSRLVEIGKKNDSMDDIISKLLGD
jgi:hypothetical protein